jgi:hypothetical protein
MGDDFCGQLTASGWTGCRTVREELEAAGLPVPTAAYLCRAFPAAQWERCATAVAALRAHFASARNADQVVFGALLVPDPGRLDTRGPVGPAVRAGQFDAPSVDFMDERLPAGRLSVESGRDWSLVATVVGAAGLSMGSYDDVVSAPAAAFTVNGVDTRALMTRQVWGARVLQSGSTLPDCSERERWTFTLFPGEGLTAGLAASGTVLHDRVRFRLGQSGRSISSARVCPAILVT